MAGRGLGVRLLMFFGLAGAPLVAQGADVVEFEPALDRPGDFHEFWTAQVAALPEVEFSLTKSDELSDGNSTVWELEFPSVDGESQVLGWYRVPAAAGSESRTPAVLELPGYGGRRGDGPPNFGPACGLVIGYRGGGDDPWPGDWLTRGLASPESSVFRVHYLNAVRAVRFLQGRPEVDAGRIFLFGRSLGGGTSVVVAGLLRDEIAGVVASKPGVSYYFDGAGEPAETTFDTMRKFVVGHPEQAATIQRVLSYHAQINFAPDVTAEVLLCAAGQDAICPPKMVYAMHNHLGSKVKEIAFYPDMPHGRGPGTDDWNRLAATWLAARLQPSPKGSASGKER